MSGDLKVTPANLRTVASQQDQAAGQLGSSAAIAHGVGWSMFANHGVICSAAAAATGGIEGTRDIAVRALQHVSSDLASKLRSAAGRYESTDQEHACKIDGEMHPR